MSIQIYNDGLAGASASQAERTQGPTIGSSNPPRRDNGLSNSGSDHVAISSLSESITAAGRIDDVKQAARVSQLTALYQSGQYHVDSLQLSRTLVSQALNTGTADGR
jgi:anti-sigma28 factor (negative regulator of flagellin synthesis)